MQPWINHMRGGFLFPPSMSWEEACHCLCHPTYDDTETILWEGIRLGNRANAKDSALYGSRGNANAWSYWSNSLPWFSDATEMSLGHGERAYRLVFLKQNTDVWTGEERDAAFRVFTQEGISPTQVRIPPSVFSQIVQVSMLTGKRRLHVLWDYRYKDLPVVSTTLWTALDCQPRTGGHQSMEPPMSELAVMCGGCKPKRA